MVYYFMLINGTLQRIERPVMDPEDRGLLYGFSLFETMLIRSGRVMLMQQHLARLIDSAGALEIPVGENPAGDRVAGVLADSCAAVVRQCGVEDGVLRLTVTAGPARDGQGLVLLCLRAGLPYRAEDYAAGFTLLVLDYPRNERSTLVRHKTANYLENLLGRRRVLQRGYREGLFLNTRGNVAEGTVSNIFMVRRGELLTPPPEAGLLPGTVRQLVLEQAAGLGHPCREADFTLADLQEADECFLTNSLLGIMPVAALNDRPLGDGIPGPVTKKMMRLYPGCR